MLKMDQLRGPAKFVGIHKTWNHLGDFGTHTKHQGGGRWVKMNLPNISRTTNALGFKGIFFNLSLKHTGVPMLPLFLELPTLV